jgi:hypothetical protein
VATVSIHTKRIERIHIEVMWIHSGIENVLFSTRRMEWRFNTGGTHNGSGVKVLQYISKEISVHHHIGV